MHFTQQVILPELQPRRLLAQPVCQFHQQALTEINQKAPRTPWRVEIEENLLFDVSGLRQIQKAILQYRGNATRLRFELHIQEEAARDYYSHQLSEKLRNLVLPVIAYRVGYTECEQTDVVTINLPCLRTLIDYPSALMPEDQNSTPLALLFPYVSDHDLLFANQIAVFSTLARRVHRAPFTWLKALFSDLPGTFRNRVALCYTKIDPTAEVHPTAIIEGAVVGPGCRIGAHCVVRYSILGQYVRLHDGAKVEYSVVDNHSWLMHDLVLYRSLVEQKVFLIHGPYQFSYFQHESAAFATIMMDYRPDAQPIRISTPNGLRAYRGRFLGALLAEKAKVLGGCITAPGIIIPAGQQVSVNPDHVTRARSFLTQIHQTEFDSSYPADFEKDLASSG